VGYSGGTKKNPTYHSLGDHTETVQVDFDPAKVSYARLLEIFWASHQPTENPWSRQYMKAVFYHNDAQKRQAEESRNKVAAKLGSRVATQVLPATDFYLAEDYHQKYALRLRAPDIAREFLAFYPDLKDLVNSTAVARVNGYLGGFGDSALFQAELNLLGLSPSSREKLSAMVHLRRAGDRKRPPVPSGACPL
jgi:methionine-S-sulfoxide reductase